MNPTTEQQHIIELIPTRANIAIQARAGAGKTSTLKLVAESYPEKTFCAIYFNKANVEELNNSGSKPDNLIGTTIHSAAYKAIMLGAFTKKLSPFLDFNDIKQDDLDELCTCIGVPKNNWKKMSIRFTKVILEVIKEFCKSDFYSISEIANVVLPDLLDNELEGCEDKLIKVIRNHWIYITDSNMAKITHDVYLKMFQLRKLQLTEVWDSVAKCTRRVDVLMLDEAQDSNPVTLGIVANQNVQKIVVGDSAQSIYGWRGAVGTMEVFNEWQQASLTTSFRFTQDIANMANIVLQRRGEDNLLTGAGSPNPKEGAVILCRKNATLWKLAFERATAGLYSYVEANFTELKSDLYHISALMAGGSPQYSSKNLAMYQTKEELIKAAKIHDELGTLIQLGNQMRNFGNGLADSLKTLQRYLITEKNPEVLCLSTIHKSKGLQWNHVTLADDFLALPEGFWEEDCDITDLLDEMWDNPEQTSLLYVAITRAKETVVLPHYLTNFSKERLW